MRKAAAISVVATIVVLGGWKFIPYLRGAAPATDSTPSVQPISAYTTVQLKPRQRLCIEPVDLGSESHYAQFLIETAGAPRSPVTVAAEATGYRSTVRLPGGVATNGPLTAKLRAIAGALESGSVCVRNDGRNTIGFIAIAAGRGLTRARTTVDGRPVAARVSLTLLNSLSESRLANLPNVVNHAAALGPLAPWVIWILIVLVAVGVPAALAVALARSE